MSHLCDVLVFVARVGSINYPSLRRRRVCLDGKSLPFDGSRRFASDVVDDAVDAADFVDNAAADALEDVVGQRGPVGGHTVFRMHGGGWPRSRCPFQTTVRVPPVPRTWGPGRLRTSIAGAGEPHGAQAPTAPPQVVADNFPFPAHNQRMNHDKLRSVTDH